MLHEPHGRRLTSDEQTRLTELEKQLGADDPVLELQLRHGRPRADARDRAMIACAAGVTVGLLGLAALVGGVGGAGATVVALLATLGVWMAGRHALRRAAR